MSVWAIAPEAALTSRLELVAGVMLGVRLARWRGEKTLREPLLWVLHLGYGWLSFGLLLLGFNSLAPALPQTTALHALTVGAIGTMTLAVMTRASLGHTGRPLVAGPGTRRHFATSRPAFRRALHNHSVARWCGLERGIWTLRAAIRAATHAPPRQQRRCSSANLTGAHWKPQMAQNVVCQINAARFESRPPQRQR